MHHLCSKVLSVTLSDGVCQQMSRVENVVDEREREREMDKENKGKWRREIARHNVTLGKKQIRKSPPKDVKDGIKENFTFRET